MHISDDVIKYLLISISIQMKTEQIPNARLHLSRIFGGKSLREDCRNAGKCGPEKTPYFWTLFTQ